MKILQINCAALAAICFFCSLLGASSLYFFQQRFSVHHVLKVQDLQIVDNHGEVRAEMSISNDSNVSLILNSKDKVPVVEMGSGEALKPDSAAGYLLIRDKQSTPIIALGGSGNGHGSLLFSTPQVRNQVAVGYQPDGDVIDGHDRAIWGIGIRGAGHSWEGIGARTKDGIFQEFTPTLK